jgi:aromatic-L-amino-acid decarboxylase
MADYQSEIVRMPIRAQVNPLDVKNSLPFSSPPTSPESLDNLIQDLQKIIVSGVTQVQHPIHYGWNPSNASLSSVLGDITSSGLGTLRIS